MADKRKPAPRPVKGKPKAKSGPRKPASRSGGPPSPAGPATAVPLARSFTTNAPIMSDADWGDFFRVVGSLLQDARVRGSFSARDVMNNAAAARGATGQLMQFRNIYT